MTVEEAFGIRISDEIASEVVTVEDLVKAVLHQIEYDPVDAEDRICWQCRYSLRGLDSNRCPECGVEFIPHDQATVTRVWKLLVDILVSETGVERTRIKPNTRILKDLGLD
ncbi:MAG: hypothetical protein AAGH99_07120 [Planctomycetota bacterium]